MYPQFQRLKSSASTGATFFRRHPPAHKDGRFGDRGFNSFKTERVVKSTTAPVGSLSSRLNGRGSCISQSLTLRHYPFGVEYGENPDFIRRNQVEASWSWTQASTQSVVATTRGNG
jgi:hypothetical protein